MPARRWHIRDHAALFAVMGEIGKVQPPFFLTLKEGEEKRRDRQNRFAFEAYNQIARILGDRTTEEVRAESKLEVGVPIVRAADDDFREKYDAMIRPLPREHKLAMMVEPFDFAVTRIMTVKLMAEYITQMLAHWDARGASFALPDYDI